MLGQDSLLDLFQLLVVEVLVEERLEGVLLLLHVRQELVQELTERLLQILPVVVPLDAVRGAVGHLHQIKDPDQVRVLVAVAHGLVVDLPGHHPLLEPGHDHRVLDNLVSLQLPDYTVDNLQSGLQQRFPLIKVYRFLKLGKYTVSMSVTQRDNKKNIPEFREAFLRW